ncbi:unnamed protein product [Moneuplotes crassus]|uniref:Uncharacterized protein n=1 Tax=Euplotes crassus TaxID=5936 RepID=A0AAD2D8Z2_EUPCR|nr:unnamed protein product [Moneuplotes crassus]
MEPSQLGFKTNTLKLPVDTVNQDIFTSTKSACERTIKTCSHKLSLSPIISDRSFKFGDGGTYIQQGDYVTPQKCTKDNSFDYCATPSMNLQSKIEYFMVPYNASVNIQKHMTFETENRRQASQARTSGNGWKNIRKMILQQDVEFLHHNLSTLNEGLLRATEPPKEICQIYTFDKKKKYRKQKRSFVHKTGDSDSLIMSQFKSKIPNFGRIGKRDLNQTAVSPTEYLNSPLQDSKTTKSPIYTGNRNRTQKMIPKLFTNNRQDEYSKTESSSKRLIPDIGRIRPLKPSNKLLAQIKRNIKPTVGNMKLKINPERVHKTSICSTAASFTIQSPNLVQDKNFFNSSLTIPSTNKAKKRRYRNQSIDVDTKNKFRTKILNVYSPDTKNPRARNTKLRALEVKEALSRTIF